MFPTEASMFARYEANNVANTISTLSQTFTSLDVDTVNNKLALSGLNYVANSGTLGKGQVVYFSSTGTLPAPLVAATPYYLNPASGSGYNIYPVATTATQPGSVTGETILAAQNWGQTVNPVILTTGGTGTHTVSSAPSLVAWADLTGNGYTLNVTGASDRHTYLASSGVGTTQGFDFPGPNVRDNTTGATENDYGQLLLMNVNKFAGRSQSAGANTAWLVVTASIAPYVTRVVVKKDTFLSSGVNITTGVITATAHPFATADLVNVASYSTGSALPTGLTAATDYYARKIDANTISLHPTATDATNNTNVIIPSTQGSGTLTVNAPATVGGLNDPFDLGEWLDPTTSANTISATVITNGASSNTILNAASVFTITGANNGNITSLNNYPDASAVTLAFPPRTVGPVRSDTGLALAAGTYWVSASGSSKRLHTSQADAQASVGVATSACTLCIKYSGVAGSGSIIANYGDGKFQWAFGAGAANKFTQRFNTGELHVWGFKVDWNPSCCATPVWSLYVDGVLNEANVPITATKGNLGTPAVNDGSSPWTPGNSIAQHVPFGGTIRSWTMGVSTSELTAAPVVNVSNYYKALYGL